MMVEWELARLAPLDHDHSGEFGGLRKARVRNKPLNWILWRWDHSLNDGVTTVAIGRLNWVRSKPNERPDFEWSRL